MGTKRNRQETEFKEYKTETRARTCIGDQRLERRISKTCSVLGIQRDQIQIFDDIIGFDDVKDLFWLTILRLSFHRGFHTFW
jgi:hypothetical protein